jgi:glycosyltransferase involved in cell wall biosynthesis
MLIEAVHRPLESGASTVGVGAETSAVDLSLVMPAFNEETALPEVLDDARLTLANAPFTYEVVVVDDASTDASPRILDEFHNRYPQFPLRVLRHSANRGIAASCATLFGAARGRYVFLNASDGQCKASECVKMMAMRDAYDLVIGVRQSKHYRPWRAFISRAFNLLPLVLFGVRTLDAGSIKLYRAEVLAIPLASQGPFREAERIIRARRRGFRVGAIPIENRPRRGGRASGARWSLILEAVRDLCRCWWRIVVLRQP